MIVLNTYRNNNLFKSDTTLISDGIFRFKGKEFLDGTAVFQKISKVDTINYDAELILEKGNIEVYLDSISIVKGGRLNDTFEKYKPHKLEANFIDSLILQNVDNPVGLILVQKYNYVL